MHIFEKLKRRYVVEAQFIDISLSGIFLDLIDYYQTKENIEKKIIEFLNYITNDNIFYLTIENANGIKQKKEVNDTLVINEILNCINEIIPNTFVNLVLTDKGKDYAHEYLEKNIKSCEEIIKAFENKNYLGFGDLFSIVNNEYNFEDLEELQIEMPNVITKLISFKLINIGELKNNIFYKWDIEKYSKISEKIVDEFIHLKDYPKNNDIGWLELTNEGKRVLGDWQKNGGRIQDYWIVPKFNREEFLNN